MATLDSSTDPNHLHVDSLSLIDLRLLSQSELYSMSLRSSSSAAYHLHRRSDDDAIIPKIDRSVFNESAGSRKQTFSRLHLAPRDNQIANASSSITGIPLQNPEPVDEEHAQIIGLLQQLFGVESFCDETNDDGSLFPVQIEFRDPLPESATIAFQNIPIDVVDGAPRKRKRGRPRKNEIPGVRVEEKAIKGKEEDRLAMTMVNNHSVPVEATALVNFEDPFGEEINRRTQGLVTESQLLEFLGTLNGEWVSQRKKRKIVLASDFGGLLPSGWKIMLSLKRRAGRVWIFCRRYISPDGHQFVSCKEVSSYLLSFFGLQDVSQSKSCHTDGNLQVSSKMTSENHNGCVPKTGMKSDGVASSSHIPCTSICIDLERQATVAASIGSEKQSTFNEIVNDYLASKVKIRNTASGNVTDLNCEASLLSEDHQTLDGDKNDTNSVLGPFSEVGIDCKLHNERFVDVNRADDISLVIPISFSNNKSTGSYECSDETNGIKCIKDGINNFVSQDVNVACYETVTCVNEQACLGENSGHGPSSRSVEDSRHQIGKKCSGSSIEDGHLITSLEDMKISDQKRFEDERGRIISGNCHSETKKVSSRAEVISCSQGSSIVPSQNELECASVNSKNGVLTSMTTDSAGGKCSDNGLSNSSTDERTCAASNNVNSVSCTSTQDVSKFGGIDVAPNVKATVDFGDNHATQNDYVVTSCTQERSSLNEKSFNIELENPSHGSSEENLLIPTGNLHPNVFDDQNHGDSGADVQTKKTSIVYSQSTIKDGILNETLLEGSIILLLDSASCAGGFSVIEFVVATLV
ncbi:hypothetical protein L6164_030597 [Bauhinia variegata]|uniref:Uncharacterized protein n=1 Tax=Bauhinia variegata TaxID=167791 RepID=A0ACB9LDP5_BAUVA|nr:hypothetical protein L6164_030597 [Bauhinia variegata]